MRSSRLFVALVLLALCAGCTGCGGVSPSAAFRQLITPSGNPDLVTVTITAPTSSATYDAGASDTLTTLAGTATTNPALTTCRWENNQGGLSGATTGTNSWSVGSIALTIGLNVITVSCTNAIGLTGTDTLTVTRSAAGGGDTFPAANCTSTAVQTAVNMATHGDTVTIPACGQTNWTAQVNVSVGITIQGAGQGTTILGDNVTKDGGGTSSLIQFNVNSPNTFALSDLTIVGVAADTNVFNKGHLSLTGTATGFRIHHVTMNAAKTSFAALTGDLRGLFDHLTVNDCTTGANGSINLKMGGWGGSDYGDGSWAAAVNPGSSTEAVYIEDSDYNCIDEPFIANMVDGNMGTRFVFRFNTLTGGNVTSHGTDSSGRERSIRWQEVYKNTFNFDPATGPDFLAWIRGGSGVMWGNAVTAAGGINQMLKMLNCRDDAQCGGPSFSPWGACNGSSAFDQNASGGYRCVDQPGAGTSNDLMGAATPPSEWVGNILYPAYTWLNTLGGDNNNTISGSANVAANRDYYAGTASFTGTSGTGWGTIASRPSTCTTGVGYWATDEGEWWAANAGNDGRLYKCTATNTWTLYYTPAVYPHPLNN